MVWKGLVWKGKRERGFVKIMRRLCAAWHPAYLFDSSVMTILAMTKNHIPYQIRVTIPIQ